MSLINQLKLYIIWLVITPWVGAFLVEDVLPSNGAYGLAQALGFFTWMTLAIAGMLYFVGNCNVIAEDMKEWKQTKDNT